MDGFREDNETFLGNQNLQVVEGDRGHRNNKIDGFVLSRNLEVNIPNGPIGKIFHPDRNPRTVKVSIHFDHNPICLKVGPPTDEANNEAASGSNSSSNPDPKVDHEPLESSSHLIAKIITQGIS